MVQLDEITVSEDQAPQLSSSRVVHGESTARDYLRSVHEFAAFSNRPPAQLGPEHIREYTAHLEGRNLSSSAVNQQVAALRFFYVKTIRKAWSVEDTPYAKREKPLPVLLSVEGVSLHIDTAQTPPLW